MSVDCARNNQQSVATASNRSSSEFSEWRCGQMTQDHYVRYMRQNMADKAQSWNVGLAGLTTAT
jgi:hypothetical protein